MKNITQADLNKIIEASAELAREKSWWDSTYSTDPRRANLRDVDLSGLDLTGASLDGASLDGASLVRASLVGASLVGASLDGASLDGARLDGASLVRASLVGASLVGASLVRASLVGASLVRATFNEETVWPAFYIVPEVGAFIGWKKLSDGHAAQVEIPAAAKRACSVTGRKCRAEFVKTLTIVTRDGSSVEGPIPGMHDRKVTYTVGEITKPDAFDDNFLVECAAGIHFFVTAKEAQDYA